MIHNNSSRNSFSYSIGSSGCSNNSGSGSGSGGSSSEADSIFFFAEEKEILLYGVGREDSKHNFSGNYIDSPSNKNNSSGIGANNETSTTTGSVMTMRRSINLRERGMEPCEEKHPQQRQLHHNVIPVLKKIQDPPPSSSTGCTTTTSGGIKTKGIAKHHDNNKQNNTMKKRQNFDMWVMRQQQQQQQIQQQLQFHQYQRDGNMSILTDEMSEVHLQYHLSQKRLQKQLQQQQHQSHLHKNHEEGQPQSQRNEQRLERSEQNIMPQHYMQQHPSQISLNRRRYDEQPFTNTTLHPKDEEKIVQEETEEEEEEEENHWQPPIQYHCQDSHHQQQQQQHRHKQKSLRYTSNKNHAHSPTTCFDMQSVGIPNYHRRRWRQQQQVRQQHQRSRYSEVGDDYVMKKVDEEVGEEEEERGEENDEEIVQHEHRQKQQQQQQQQPQQLQYHHQRWQEPPPSLQRESTLQHSDDHRPPPPPQQQQQQPRLSSHLSPGSNIIGNHKQKMQQPWSCGELGVIMTNGTFENMIEVEELVLDMEEDVPILEIVDHPNQHHHHHHHHHRTGKKNVQEGGMAVVQLVKNIVQMAELDEPRTMLPTQQQQPLFLPSTLELTPTSVSTASLRPPTHPDSHSPSNNTSANIGSSSTPTTSSSLKEINPTLSIGNDGNLVLIQEMTSKDDVLVMPPPTLLSVASSSFSSFSPEQGAITSPLSLTIATTTSASYIATAVAQRVDGNSLAAKHDESYNTSTATNDRNSIRPGKIINHMSEQSPTRSDHSADNAAGLGNSFGHVSFATTTTSSSNNNNNREKNSTMLPSTSSLFMKKGVFLLSGTPATKPFSLKGAPAKCSIDTSVCESSDEGTIDSVKRSIPRKVSFDESEVDLSIPPQGKVLNLEGKLSGLLQRQRRRQLQSEQSPDNNDMMMISRSRTFDSSNTNQSLTSSLQLSIESECVRQNARIAEMMEGAMMDFFELSHATESNEKRTSTDAVPATDNEEVHVRITDIQTIMPGLFYVGEDDQNELAAVMVHDAISPSDSIAKVDSVPASHKMTHPKALPSANNDNKDLAKFLVKFSDHILNGCNNYDTDSSDVFFISNSQFGKEGDASQFEGNRSDDHPDKMATSTAVAPHNLTRSAAFGRDVSSISEDSDEENLIHTLHPFEKSRSLPNLPPASTFLSAKERARIRQHDTTPVRANTSYARYRKYVHMHSDGDISMASIKEEMAEEEEECDGEIEKVTVEKVNVKDERVPILEKEEAPYHSRDDEMGGVLSEAFDHHSARRIGIGNIDLHDESFPSCDSATNVAEYDTNDLLLSQSKTFEGNQDANLHPNMIPHCQVFETSESKPLDPPSDVSLDVDRSEDFDENNQSLSSDSILDVIKMTFREQQKGRSLAWHSTNGVNYDEVCDTNQMPRFKATGGASIAGRLNSMTMSRLASTFRQHTDDVMENSGAVKRHQLGLIEETSLEDDGESEHCSRGGIGIDHDYIQSDQERTQAIKSSSMSEAASSSVSGSKTPIPAPRSSVRNRVVEHLPSSKENSFVRDAKKNASTKDLPPIIRFETQPNSRPPHCGPQPVRSKQTNLGESSTCFARSNQTMKKSQFLHAPSSRLHPHHVPHELPRSRLEEKLRDNSIRESRKIGDCANNSVGTSELGSLFTRDSERSRNLPVPSVIFHRTYPPLDLSLSKSSKILEFSGANVSSKDLSFSEGSKSSSCTPDSGYPILNGQHLVNQPHTSPLHADESDGGAMDIANPARQIIDISELIYNFQAVGSTIAKLGEELFENAAADAASPNALGGYAPDNEQHSAVFLDETDVAKSEYGIHLPEQQQEQKRIIIDTSIRYDIENKANDVDPSTSSKDQSNKNIKPQQQFPIASIKDTTSREPSTLHDAKYPNNDNKHQGQSFWRKIDEHKVRSFWSQLELDDELSTSKLQYQPQQRVVPVIKALNKNVGRRVADDASASHHSSIFEAFEVAPLRFICRVGDEEKPATLLNDFGVHHSYVRPVSFANNLVYPENADDAVLYPSNLEPIERTNAQLSCHSASIANKEKSERSIVDADEVSRRSRTSEISTDQEMRFESLRQRPKTIAVEQAPHPNNKARQSIRGKWKNIVMAGPAMMASTRH